jgi:4'-phosphopantetheinyl transferase
MWLTAGTIDVWFVGAGAPSAVVDRLACVLTSSEQARAARFHFEADHRRFTVARASLRLLLGRCSGADPASIEIASPDGAKPEAPALGVHFNVSHAGEMVALAFASDVPVGVDVERLRPMRDAAGIARRWFSPDERRAVEDTGDLADTFFRIWTAKEAVVKGTGGGLSSGLASFTVPFRSPVLAPVQAASGTAFDGWQVASLEEAGDGYRAAVAARTARAIIRVTTTTADQLLC